MHPEEVKQYKQSEVRVVTSNNDFVLAAAVACEWSWRELHCALYGWSLTWGSVQIPGACEFKAHTISLFFVNHVVFLNGSGLNSPWLRAVAL